MVRKISIQVKHEPLVREEGLEEPKTSFHSMTSQVFWINWPDQLVRPGNLNTFIQTGKPVGV